MKKTIFIIFILYLNLIACNSNTSNKEKQLIEKEKELLQKENQLLRKEISQLNTTTKSDIEDIPQNKKSQQIDWLGTWRFQDNAPVEYIIKIEGKYKNMNLCTFNATGVQTYYDLECRGIANGNSFEIYYYSVNDGVFWLEDKINTEKPIMTLRYVNGKIITYWNQLINNYVEQGNRSGQVCFKKE